MKKGWELAHYQNISHFSGMCESLKVQTWTLYELFSLGWTHLDFRRID